MIESAQASLPVPVLRIQRADPFDVRTFKVEEHLGRPFSIDVTVVSPDPDLDLETLIGEVGRFEIGPSRSWTGVVRTFQHLRAERDGLSHYRIEMVASLWLLTQRRNHRIFQRMTEPAMAMEILSEWKIPFEPRLDFSAYKRRDYRVQYAESDFAFLSRMLEDSGITYWFESLAGESVLVLSDAPQASRPAPALPFVDDASAVPPGDFVTEVTVVRELRPGRYTVRDVDYRLPPGHALIASVGGESRPVEGTLESFHYVPGAFLFEGTGADTPTADDKLTARTSEAEAELLARRRLDAKRCEAKTFGFRTNALSVRPGVCVPISGHPRSDLGLDRPVLVVEAILQGETTGRWSMACRACRSDLPYRPSLTTVKPKVSGVETATVVGPAGEEIHTDEFGRIRVHFHWDRLSRMNDDSSCWISVSNPWAGAAFGGVNLPRVGQEVIVDFLGGDPDRPVVTGRVYTASQPVPYKLPDLKTQSGWKSNSTDATGGYNEIMFEDAAGRELLRVQAEKDLHHLVKNDEERSVLRDRTRDVRRDESVTIGRNRATQVVANDRLNIGQNRAVNVGINRKTHIGSIDCTSVGETHVVMVAPPGEDGMTTSSSVTLTDKKIVLDTGGGATITMDHDKITLHAKTIEVFADDYIELRGKKKGIALQSPAGKNSFTGKTFSVATDIAVISGESRAVLASMGLVEIGAPTVRINGPAPPAARLGDKAPDSITEGSSTVSIGGASTTSAATQEPMMEGPFATPEEAAQAGAKAAHELAALDPNSEYHGVVYTDTEGNYYYSRPTRMNGSSSEGAPANPEANPHGEYGAANALTPDGNDRKTVSYYSNGNESKKSADGQKYGAR